MKVWKRVRFLKKDKKIDMITKSYVNYIYENSPINEMTCCNQITGINRIPLKNRIKASINYYRYGKLASLTMRKLFKSSKNKILSVVTIPISYIFKIK